MTTAAYSNFNADRFRRQVDAALVAVKNILDTTRTPRCAADEDHAYDDKYGLSEFLCNSALAAQMNVLEGLGADDGKIANLREMAVDGKRSVTLRFEAEVACEFVEERVVDVAGGREFVTEIEETRFGKEEEEATIAINPTTSTNTLRHKVVTKVTEFHWRVGLKYVIYAYAGSDPEASAVVFQNRSSSAEVVTTGNKVPPLPAMSILSPLDTSLNWLFDNLKSTEEGLACSFVIDRSTETCRTPRRNGDIEGALEFFGGMKKWSDEVRSCLTRDIEGKIFTDIQAGGSPLSATPESRVSLHAITDEGVFVPVLPLLESPKSRDATRINDGTATSPGLGRIISHVNQFHTASSPLLSVADVNLFLKEQRRSLGEKVAKMTQTFPSKVSEVMISSAEAIIVLLSLHSACITDHFSDGVGYIEEMLRSQMIKAIGKEVQGSDFAEFIRFHNQKFLRKEYVPKPFCYSIRRPDHSPDGVLSIEGSSKDTADPVATMTCKLRGASSGPMFFPINAATSVEITGDRYLHAWLLHRFSGRQDDKFKLVARARQFSSFLLLVGKISGPNTFEPHDAVILQNKDEILIPLLLNPLPTPKEFSDAISSLSPEQRQFATAFREMQLESSVFAVCCVQIKPQIETLLGLPEDSLTKEIRLTQDLLSLFIDYQIPSDLLSFDGSGVMSSHDKVGVVKGHVESVLNVIKSMKDKDLQAAREKADMAFEMQQKASPVTNHGGGIGMESQRKPARNRRLAQMKQMVSPDTNHGGGIRMESQRIHARTRILDHAPPPSLCYKSVRLMSSSASDTFDTLVQHNESEPEPLARSKKAEQPILELGKGSGSEESSGDTQVMDFTRIPKILDSKFEELDDDSALRTTVIKTAEIWTKKMKQNLLSTLEEKSVGKEDRKSERNKAFDLLDAISRSGSLPISCAELHIIVAATHSFDNSLIDTVIKDNVNPIEKMEKSLLIVASTIHGAAIDQMIKDKSEVSRLEHHSPALFLSS